jgi:hypothetical protein
MQHRRHAPWWLSLCLACTTAPGDTTEADTTSTTGDTTTADPSTGASPTTAPDPTTGTDATTDATTTADPTTADPTTAEPTTADPTTGEPTTDTDDPSGDPPAVQLPPADAGLDYQLGGAYPPPRGVGVVSRDRNAPPADGLYNVCYVNGFQTQPDEEAFWLEQHPDLILRDENDEPVIDEDWGEMLLDTRTPESRAALAEIVGGWISGCGAAGYQAIEIDNLDSYARSDGLLDQDQAVAYMALLSAAAHAGGMAIAQKNSTELLPRRAEMATDFAVSEECNHYDECDDYIDTYGDAVLMVEYSDADFDKGCAAYPQISIVRRDLDLTVPGEPEYVYDGC